MATYQITGPDGGTYEVTAPDTASESEVLAYAQKNYAPKAPAAPTLDKADRFMQGLRDPIDGGAQLLTNMLPNGVVNAGNRLNNWLADHGLTGRLPEGGVDQQVREREQAYQAGRGPDAGFDGMRLLGNLTSPANIALGYAGGAVPAATLGARMATGAAVGAANSAITPVTQGDFGAEKGKQIGIGSVLGGLTPAVAAGVARVVSPQASVNPNVQLLKNEGVTPTIGQALGGRWNSLEEKATSIPIAGDMISNARGRALEQFNNAAINRATAPVGARVDGAGQEAVRKAGDTIGNVYEQGKNALGAFRIDPQGATELASLRQLARTGLEGRERKVVEGYFKDYLQRPALTGDAFKELDSKLAKDAASFGGSNDAYQQKVGDVLAEVRRIVSDNAKRANPQAADTLRKADEAWARLVRVEGAAKAGMNNGGVFTPAQLNMAARQADNSVRDRATARGTALMQDLGNAGQQVIGNKVPNSFTTDRALIAGGGLGSYLINPMIPAALVGAGAMYTKPMQSLLSGAVTARPQSAQAMAEALRKASPSLGLLGSQMGMGLLGN